MMYNKYPEISDLYILHRYSIGMSQDDESFLEEIIASGGDREVLEQRGRELYPDGPISTAGGWRQDHWVLVVNTSTEAGRAMYESQKAEWEYQWKQIDEHPEDNEGWFIAGDRRSSDYDFSFEVQKSIAYATPVAYTTDIGTKRKSNIVTRYHTTKAVSVLKLGDGSRGYGSWPEAISANNYQQLEEKVNKYLDELMAAINEPLQECTCCNGTGVMLTK